MPCNGRLNTYLMFLFSPSENLTVLGLLKFSNKLPNESTVIPRHHACRATAVLILTSCFSFLPTKTLQFSGFSSLVISCQMRAPSFPDQSIGGTFPVAL